MAGSAIEKDDLQKTLPENNKSFNEEKQLISDALSNEMTKTNDKNVAENNFQDSDSNSKDVQDKNEQDNGSDNKSDDVNTKNLTNNQINSENQDSIKENKHLKQELVNEIYKNANKESYAELKDAEEKKEDKESSRRMSNYVQNIKIMTNSTVGLTLNGSEKKDTTLLTDTKTVTLFSPLWKQTLATFAPILVIFVSGLTSGYSAILLPQLKNNPGTIPSDEDTTSWIAAMAVLPMAPGCLISGWMMEKFGRKTSHYITCVPLILGWIFIASSYNLGLMLLGRFLTGLCSGLSGPLVPVYIGETTEPKYRGFFLAAVSLAIAFGILVAHVLGTFLSWQYTAVICTVFPVLCTGLLSFIPESPTWLISQGRTEDGAKAFYWLRGYGEDAKLELKGIIDSKKATDDAPRLTWKEKLISLKSPELIKPLFIMIMFFCTCQFSGVNAVAFYSIEIVEKAVGKGIDHYLAMLIIDSLRVVMSIVACVICKQYGRRPLCFISGIWTSVSMVGLSMFLYWKPENMSWLPLMLLMCYICAISIGLVPLPWIMCGEVFPTKVRGLGSGISSATTFVAFFIVVKTAPGLMSNFGEVITFLSYGIIALIGTALMYFILPETKGKSLQEIEEGFRNGKNASDPKV